MDIKPDLELNQFLRNIDSLLQNIEQDAEKVEEAQGLQAHLDDLPAEALPGISSAPDIDGFLDFTISEDKMTVKGTFYPRVGHGEALTLNKVEVALYEAGIVYGLNLPLITSALEDCKLEFQIVEDILVASGLPPVNHQPESWQILPELLEKRQQLETNALTIDFKTISPFVYVKQGQQLTVITPYQQGRPGWNVLGEELAFSTLTPKLPVPGPNVLQRDGGHFAACDGCFVHVPETSFCVTRLLQLTDGISYKTGNIDFDGDIQVLGEVKPGFKIEVTGSIYADTVMDVTDIRSGGDLVSTSGLIGSGQSKILTEGRIVAKFLEKVQVKAKGPIEIQSSIMNSSLQSLDRIVLGKKSIIMGCRIESQNGLDCYQIGSERGARTEIVCGLDFTIMEKIVWIRDKNIELARAMRATEIRLKKEPDQAAVLTETLKKLREQSRKLNLIAQELVGKIDKNEKARISVRGTIFPGNYLEICHVSLLIVKPMTNVRFYLDKQRGIIGHEPLL